MVLSLLLVLINISIYREVCFSINPLRAAQLSILCWDAMVSTIYHPFITSHAVMNVEKPSGIPFLLERQKLCVVLTPEVLFPVGIPGIGLISILAAIGRDLTKRTHDLVRKLISSCSETRDSRRILNGVDHEDHCFFFAEGRVDTVDDFGGALGSLVVDSDYRGEVNGTADRGPGLVADFLRGPVVCWN